MAHDFTGLSTEKVLDAIHNRSGKIEPKIVPVKLLATIITIASGGAAGKKRTSCFARLWTRFSDGRYHAVW